MSYGSAWSHSHAVTLILVLPLQDTWYFSSEGHDIRVLPSLSPIAQARQQQQDRIYQIGSFPFELVVQGHLLKIWHRMLIYRIIACILCKDRDSLRADHMHVFRICYCYQKRVYWPLLGAYWLKWLKPVNSHPTVNWYIDNKWNLGLLFMDKKGLAVLFTDVWTKL